MNKYDITPAKHNDTPEILKIYQGLIGVPGCAYNWHYPNEEDIKSDIKNQALYAMKEEGRIIAVATIIPDSESSGNNCVLERFSIAPALLGQGIGTVFLKNIVALAREKGFDGIVMLVSKTNLAALVLYDKNGFERYGETSMYGIDFWRYRLKFAER